MHETELQKNAGELLGSIDFRRAGELEANDLRSLRALASTSSARLRNAALHRLAASPDYARRFNRNPAPVVRALTGLRPQERDTAVDVADGVLRSSAGVDVKRAMVHIVVALDAMSQLSRVALAATLINIGDPDVPIVSQQTTDPMSVRALARALEKLPQAELRQHAGPAQRAILAISNTQDNETLGPLTSLATKAWTPAEGSFGVELFEKLRNISGGDADERKRRDALLVQLAEHLAEEPAQRVLHTILFGAASFPHSESRILEVLAGKLNSDQAINTVARIIESRAIFLASETANRFAELLTVKLTEEKVRSTVDLILGKPVAWDSGALPISIFEAIAGRIAPREGPRYATTCADALTALGDLSRGFLLRRCVERLSAYIPESQRQSLVKQLIDKVTKTSGVRARVGAARELVAFRIQLNEAEVAAVSQIVIEAAREASDARELRFFAAALNEPRLARADTLAHVLLERMANTLKTELELEDLADLAVLIDAVTVKLGTLQMSATIDALLDALRTRVRKQLGGARGPRLREGEVETIRATLGPVSEHLSSDQARLGLMLIAEIPRSLHFGDRSPFEFYGAGFRRSSDLGSITESLARKIASLQAKEVIEALAQGPSGIAILRPAINVLGDRVLPDHALYFLTQAIAQADEKRPSAGSRGPPASWLPSLSKRVAPEHATSNFAAIVKVSAGMPDGFSSFVETLVVLAPKCRSDEAASLVEPLIRIIERAESAPVRLRLVDALLSLPVPYSERDIGRVLRHTLLNLPTSSGPEATRAPTETIKKIANRLSESQASEMFNVWLMGGQKFRPDAFASTTEALLAVSVRIHPNDARALGNLVVELIAQSLDPRRTRDLARILTALLARLPDADGLAVAMQALKSPTAVGETEPVLLEFVQKIAGNRERFDGSLWTAIDWVKRSHPSIKTADPTPTPAGADRAVVHAR